MLTTVTRVVLTTAAALTLAAAVVAPALAQHDPAEVPPPNTLMRAISVCDGGDSGVEVILDDAREPYAVTLVGSDLPEQRTEFDEEHQVHRTVFRPVPVGEYTVEIEGDDAPADGLPVKVLPCSDLDPQHPRLDVEVECRGGWGLATFVVANPATDEVRTYSLSITSPEDYVIELSPGLFLRITENLFDDGAHRAVLTGDGLDEPLVREFTVDCAKENAPGLGIYAQCDDKADVTTPAVVWVEIDNPNREAVEYEVSSGDVRRTATVPGAGHGSIDLGPFPAGDYEVTVTGSDGTETPTRVVVDNCADVVVDDDGLQVAVRCAEGESVVTMRYFAVGPYPATREFTIDGTHRYDETIHFGGDGPYQWTRYTNSFEDGAYTARLTGSGLETVERFTVDCAQDETTTPPTTPTTPTSSSTPWPTTAPTTGTATTSPDPQASPPPPGDNGGDDLPVTGTAIGGMVMLGLAALGAGSFLILSARRKRPTS